MTCSAHGTCVNKACVCETGFSGAECESCADGFVGYPLCRPAVCPGNGCSGHGTCGNGVCTCAEGYSGTGCDTCAAGYAGYPSCKAIPCTGSSCSGHGTCASGVCTCATGYAGVACAKCAAGFSGYPSCVPCECTASQGECVGKDGLKSCDDGCHWTTHTCQAICTGKKMAKSSGCAAGSLGSASCLCADATTKDRMLITFSDHCSKGFPHAVGIFDSTSGTHWDPVTLPSLNSDHIIDITCVTGHTLSWGAWSFSGGTDSWGCGEKCSKTCTNCTFVCGSAPTMGPIPLDC